MEDGTRVKIGRDNGLTSIRLSMSCNLQLNSQTQVLVTSRMKGLIVTEPKGSFLTKLSIIVINSVHEVLENRSFTILLSNFSHHARRIPKGMVFALA